MPHAPKPDRENSLYLFLTFALVGGFLEAYTFLLHGGVFCNAQTGNLVLFFLNLTGGNWADASHYLYSLLAYVAGILVSLALPLLLPPPRAARLCDRAGDGGLYRARLYPRRRARLVQPMCPYPSSARCSTTR